MKRTAGVLAAFVVLAALTAAVAIAASSPTVSTGSATKIGNNSATLNGNVNPNGNSTGYVFNYGLTNAYGLSSVSHSVGSGTKSKAVSVTVKGLTPGTVYHYRISALNKSGAALGRDRTFKTHGFPPAGVVTGPAVNVRKTVATVTGSINPNGASTTWVVQYGLTNAYGVQTFGQVIAGVKTPVPVAIQLTGLAPATLFHYRILALHGSISSPGNDGTFFTQPLRRPTPKLTTRTKPSRDRKKPYSFTTSGTLHGAGFIPASLRCTGDVALRYYAAHRQVAVVVAPVGANCKFSAEQTFKKLFDHGTTPIKVTIHFRGNGYLAPANGAAHLTEG
jgi:phosphodiesterase/alkaline phosphatase D-like protein